jgi:hypothetical protein
MTDSKNICCNNCKKIHNCSTSKYVKEYGLSSCCVGKKYYCVDYKRKDYLLKGYLCK